MNFESARKRLVETIDPELAATANALQTVPRHEFVPEAWQDLAYADRPLPIGAGVTISAPGIVADMCDHLALAAGDRTLEIGTGSGYHAAVTAEIVGSENVFSVEIDAERAESARERLADLSYHGISIRVGDGREGWPEMAPFDKVYMTCAARDFPEAIVDQTREAGLILSPIGLADQRLVLAKKRADETLDRLDCGPVQFVPTTGPEV